MSNDKQNDGKSKASKLEWASFIIAFVALVVSVTSMLISIHNTQIDRRVSVYSEAIVSLDRMAFIEYCMNNEKGNEIFEEYIDNDWMTKQLLETVEINSKLEMFDVESAKTYWEIVGKIFSEQPTFDETKYKELKESLKRKMR